MDLDEDESKGKYLKKTHEPAMSGCASAVSFFPFREQKGF